MLINTLIRHATKKVLLSDVKHLKTTQATLLFYERDEKGGYKDNRPPPSKVQLIRDGMKELKHEIALWRQEMREALETDPVYIYRPGETDIMWRFQNNDALEKWKTTADSDNNEGFSKCSLVLNNHKKAVFSGNISTRVPKDGKIKRAGYCNIQTLRARKSFKRESYIDWTCYNTLVLKVRGDGRNYLLNIATKGYFDITWNDMYHFVLYTRGGPYWQVSRIPFSKFCRSSKGRIQDIQHPLPRNKVTTFGISAGDRFDGPFQLEIDYIGVEFDPNHTEEIAYEMYALPKHVAAH